MITADRIDKYYGNVKVLSEICCQFPKGEVTAVIGENGSGKSTLISILGKYLDPNDGGVFIGDDLFTNIKKDDYALLVSTLRQTNNVQAKITVREFVSFGRFPHSKRLLNDKDWQIVDRCIGLLGCDEYADKYLNQLSGGQLQRVYLAAIFSQDTPIILLDEPLNNLDLKHSHDLMKIIRDFARNENKTVVIIMHDINMVYKYADYCIALKHGRIVHCGAITTFKCKHVLKEIYDLDFDFIRSDNYCVAYVKEDRI